MSERTVIHGAVNAKRILTHDPGTWSFAHEIHDLLDLRVRQIVRRHLQGVNPDFFPLDHHFLSLLISWQWVQ